MAKHNRKSFHTRGPWTQRFGTWVYEGGDPFNQDSRILFMAQPANGTRDELREAAANARLASKSPEMFDLICEAIEYNEDRFDAEEDLDVSGADLVDFFTDIRERMKELIDKIAPKETTVEERPLL